MTRVEVQTESDASHGWSYHVLLHHEDGATTDHTVTLSWVDHEHWSGGRCAPSRVVEAVVNYLIEHRNGEPLPATFDAARARRWLPRIDAEIRETL